MEENPYRVALSVIEPIITAQGFEKTRDEHVPEHFGSGNAEFRRGEQRLRFIWDGKEYALALQKANGRQTDWDELFFIPASSW